MAHLVFAFSDVRSVTLCFLSLTGWPINSWSRSHIGLVGASTWETQKWRQCADHYSRAAHGSECPCCQNKGLQERRRKQGAWGDYYWLQYSRGTFLRVPSFQPLKLPSQKYFAFVAQGDLAQVGIFYFFVFIFYFSQSNYLFNFEKIYCTCATYKFAGQPLNSHGWSRQNFSLQYQYNVKQTSDENSKNINEGIITWSNTKFSELTSYEFLRQTVRRITNKILRVKGLSVRSQVKFCISSKSASLITEILWQSSCSEHFLLSPTASLNAQFQVCYLREVFIFERDQQHGAGYFRPPVYRFPREKKNPFFSRNSTNLIFPAFVDVATWSVHS